MESGLVESIDSAGFLPAVLQSKETEPDISRHVALGLGKELVHMTVEACDRREPAHVAQRLPGVVGAPAPVRIHREQRDVTEHHDRCVRGQRGQVLLDEIQHPLRTVLQPQAYGGTPCLGHESYIGVRQVGPGVAAPGDLDLALYQELAEFPQALSIEGEVVFIEPSLFSLGLKTILLYKKDIFKQPNNKIPSGTILGVLSKKIKRILLIMTST